MRVGINRSEPHPRPSADYEDHFLLRILSAIRERQATTQFIAFTCPQTHAFYSGTERILIEDPGLGLGMFGGHAGALDNAIRSAGVELLLSPIDIAPQKAAAPQILLALSIGPWEKGGDAHGYPKLKHIVRACANACAIVAPTECLRRRCLDLFEVPLDKTIVAPPGVSAAFDTPQPSMLDDPYIILIDDAMSTQYVPECIEIFTKRRTDYPHSLVIVGNASGESDRLGNEVFRVDRLPDAAMAGLYRQAALVVYPAPFDGCAMRAIEVLRAGACLVMPQTPSAIELVGKAPFYYNHGNTNALIQAIRHAIGLNEEERASRIHIGRTATARFGWDKTAWKVLSAFKRV